MGKGRVKGEGRVRAQRFLPAMAYDGAPSGLQSGAGQEAIQVALGLVRDLSRLSEFNPLNLGTCSPPFYPPFPPMHPNLPDPRPDTHQKEKWKEDPPPPRVQPPPPSDPPPSPSSNAGGSLSRGPGKFFRLTVSGATQA